jgi:D-amino-acid dehydrogenase
MYRWSLRFLRECTRSRAFRNSVEQMELSQYSVRLQAEVEAEEGIQYSVVRRGAFYLYRDAHKLAKAAARIPLFESHGIEQEVVPVATIIDKEPALAAVASKFAGAIYGSSDASGDCRTFTRELARRCQEKYGVRFRTDTRVTALRSDGVRIASAETAAGPVRADLFVLALGVGSAAVARTAGVKLPIFPFKGYSATFPITDAGLVPEMPAVEQTSLIAWSRFANSLRMSSTAEMVGYDRGWTPKNFASILAMARELFAAGIDIGRGEFRSCLRPMTPDGPPIIGFGKHSNLLMNTGHGHLGWTMGLGTGLIATDLISGRRPAVQPSGRWLGATLSGGRCHA